MEWQERIVSHKGLLLRPSQNRVKILSDRKGSLAWEMQVQSYCCQTLWDPKGAQSCAEWVHRFGGTALCLQHWEGTFFISTHCPSQDKQHILLCFPKLLLSFLVVLVNCDNTRIKRWSVAGVKLLLPREGAWKRKKSDMNGKGRERLVSHENLGLLLLLLMLVRSRLPSTVTTAWFCYLQWPWNHPIAMIISSTLTEIKYIQFQDPGKRKSRIFPLFLKWTGNVQNQTENKDSYSF